MLKSLGSMLCRSLKDEQGGEVLEYVLVMGLMTLAALVVIGALGVKVLGKWTSIYDVLSRKRDGSGPRHPSPVTCHVRKGDPLIGFSVVAVSTSCGRAWRTIVGCGEPLTVSS